MFSTIVISSAQTTSPSTTTKPLSITPHVSKGCFGAPSVNGIKIVPSPEPITSIQATPDNGGYWLGDDGGTINCGDAPSTVLSGFNAGAGNCSGTVITTIITLDQKGKWELCTDNGVAAAYTTPFGDLTAGGATWYGDESQAHLAKPLVGMAITPDQKGYWLVGADGGVFTFGDAGFFGSAGNINLVSPIVGIAATSTGKGYWLVGADGGIFNYGDAGFFGSAGNINLTSPIVGIVATSTDKGYWLVAADGGIFNYGDAGFFGSAGNINLTSPITAMAATSTGKGYWLVGADGGVFTFGDAQYFGSWYDASINLF